MDEGYDEGYDDNEESRNEQVIPEWFRAKQQQISIRDVNFFGDRRQELVLIGIGLKEKKLLRELNACLLTDEEMQMPGNELRALDNPILFEEAADVKQRLEKANQDGKSKNSSASLPRAIEPPSEKQVPRKRELPAKENVDTTVAADKCAGLTAGCNKDNRNFELLVRCVLYGVGVGVTVFGVGMMLLNRRK